MKLEMCDSVREEMVTVAPEMIGTIHVDIGTHAQQFFLTVSRTNPLAYKSICNTPPTQKKQGLRDDTTQI